jgi:hypothetical protein
MIDKYPDPTRCYSSEKKDDGEKEEADRIGEWERYHGISVYKTADGGFRATTVRAVGYGKDRRAALLDWAEKSHTHPWTHPDWE